jgi:hypothetical protein
VAEATRPILVVAEATRPLFLVVAEATRPLFLVVAEATRPSSLARILVIFDLTPPFADA